jgi:hypothetical protein
MDYYLNELSLQAQAPDLQTAESWVLKFLQVCKAVEELGLKKLYVSDNFHYTQFYKDYPLSKFRNSPYVNQEVRTRFKSLMIHTPYIFETEYVQSDYTYKGNIAMGFGLAFCKKTLSVSFDTAEDWQNDRILLDSGQQVNHASNRSHVALHKNWLIHLNYS